MEATTCRIHPRSVTREKDNVFLGEIPLDNGDGALRPGMKGRAADPHRLAEPGLGPLPSAVELLDDVAGLVTRTIAADHVREPITATLKLREDLVFTPDLCQIGRATRLKIRCGASSSAWECRSTPFSSSSTGDGRSPRPWAAPLPAWSRRP